MRILITAGPTREYIDPVRYLSNASSGQMGYSLASSAKQRGHEVTLISGPVFRRTIPGVSIARIVSARDMFEEVKKQFALCDALIMAAAVSDFTPKHPSGNKIKKTRQTSQTLELSPTVDILQWAGQTKNRQMVVGFALEDRSPRENAQKKLKEKNLDMIVLNSPDAIGSNRSQIDILIAPDQWQEYKPARKSTNANRILKQVEAVSKRKSVGN